MEFSEAVDTIKGAELQFCLTLNAFGDTIYIIKSKHGGVLLQTQNVPEVKALAMGIRIGYNYGVHG